MTSEFSSASPATEQAAHVPQQTLVQTKKLVPWIIYLIFFAVLNETVFNVSTPKIAEQFALNASGVSWMMTIFMVFFGIGSVIYGKLSDIFSLRSLIVLGIVIYSFGSLLGFVLQFSYPLVIVSRAIQGIGASAIPALVFVVVARYIPVDERGKIFGLITSFVSISIGVGPVIGGFVSGHMHWAFLFLIPLLIPIAVPFLLRQLPAEPRRPGKVDVLGAVLVALAVGDLVVYLNLNDWYYALAFVVLMATLIVYIHAVKSPFIEPGLFKNIPFRNGVIVGFCLFSIFIGIFFLIPLMLYHLHGLDPSQIGLILFPGAISSVIIGPIAGSLADRKGNTFVVSIGFVLLIVSLILLAFTLSISAVLIAVCLLITNVGFSFFQTAMMNNISQTLSPEETGVGMGIFNLVTIIAGAVGTALVGKVLDTRWLEFQILPVDALPAANGYSNLVLVFGLVVAFGAIVYLRSYRKTTV